MFKSAIRIVSGQTGEKKLFAVCSGKNDEIVRHYILAKESIAYGSSDWVEVNAWAHVFEYIPPSYWDFPAGNLF